MTTDKNKSTATAIGVDDAEGGGGAMNSERVPLEIVDDIVFQTGLDLPKGPIKYKAVRDNQLAPVVEDRRVVLAERLRRALMLYEAQQSSETKPARKHRAERLERAAEALTVAIEALGISEDGSQGPDDWRLWAGLVGVSDNLASEWGGILDYEPLRLAVGGQGYKDWQSRTALREAARHLVYLRECVSREVSHAQPPPNEPNRGRQPNLAYNELIEELTDIYAHVFGEVPGVTGQTYGYFFRFLKACLDSPPFKIPYHSESALADRARQAAREHRDRGKISEWR